MTVKSKSRKVFGDYYLGLDIGTSSVGWAATDLQYNLLKLNGKSFWGSRLFEEGKTAAERRGFRVSRRRLERRKQRLQWLNEMFASEINQVDDRFFARLAGSKLKFDDKTYTDQLGVIFAKKKQEQEFYEKYPTIYHLRRTFLKSESEKSEIEKEDTKDIRLLYLVLHHLLKTRGHFLLDADINFEQTTEFEPCFSRLNNYLRDRYEIAWSEANLDQVECLLKRSAVKKDHNNREYRITSISDIKKELAVLLLDDAADSEGVLNQKQIFTLLSGGKGDLSQLFADEGLREIKESKFSFQSNYLEEIRPNLENVLDDSQLELLDNIKAVYDWSVLVNILVGEKFISVAKVKAYEKYGYELKLLKKIIKNYDPKFYKEIFVVSKKKVPNYCAYTGITAKNGKKINLSGKDFRCDRLSFIKYLKTSLGISANGKDTKGLFSGEQESELLAKLVDETLLKKLRISDNGVIPNQVHKYEMEEILKNCRDSFPFLSHQENGITIIDKLLKMMSFRIPYFVGPLVSEKQSKFAWMTRLEQGKIFPWNFKEKVNLAASSESFIERMLNTCTYIPSAKVLPKQSLLYQKYLVLNELNNIRLFGERLSVELKQKIFDQLFCKKTKVTVKTVLKFFTTEGIYQLLGKDVTKDDIAGLDSDFTQNLSSWVTLEQILGDKIKKQKIVDLVEEIIRLATIFGEDSSAKEMLLEKVKQVNDVAGNLLTEAEIKSILQHKYVGWGKFSKQFLTEIKGQGICNQFDLDQKLSIIDALYHAPANLMELLSENYFSFNKNLEHYNQQLSGTKQDQKITYDLVAEAYISPPIKKSVWQALQITREIVKITGHLPKKVFVETTRADGEKGKKTSSRKKQLDLLYKQAKKDCHEINDELLESLQARDENELKSKKLFLYYQQLGKCLYSGERIELNQLNDDSIYQIDHIYPRSKTKDDSWDNLVLVKSELNQQKKDRNLCEVTKIMGKSEARELWKLLRRKNFISKEKYYRLTRNTPLADDELAKFISRQLVETSQANKTVKDILVNTMGVDVVFSKAGNVSDFRHEFNLLKCREINNLHHAHDAYLNVVVGNVYDVKFTKNPYNFIKHNRNYSLKPEVFWRDWDVGSSKSGSDDVWAKATRHGLSRTEKTRRLDYDESKDQGTIIKIRKILARPNVLVTRLSHVGRELLPKVTIYPAGEATIPMKKNLSVDKYGGFRSSGVAYFVWLESTDEKDKRIRTLEVVSVINQKQAEKDLITYFEAQGLKEVKIIIPRIKIGQLVSLDGSLATIAGKTGKQFTLNNANELYLSKSDRDYIKKILSFVAFREQNENALLLSKSTITQKQNLWLYQVLTNKMNAIKYKTIFVPAWSVDVANAQEKFTSQTIEDQCKIISQMLIFFGCNALKLNIDKIDVKASQIKTNQCFAKWTDVELVYQSITGVFEQRTNMRTCKPFTSVDQ